MTTTTHAHEVAPARLQAPGAVAHKEQTLMNNQHRTDTTPAKSATAAVLAMARDLDSSRRSYVVPAPDGTCAAVALAPRTRDATVRAIYRALTEDSFLCSMERALPPTLVDDAPGVTDGSPSIEMQDAADELERLASLIIVVRDLLSSHVALVPAADWWNAVETMIGEARREIAEQLIDGPYEELGATAVLVDLDRLGAVARQHRLNHRAVRTAA